MGECYCVEGDSKLNHRWRSGRYTRCSGGRDVSSKLSSPENRPAQLTFRMGEHPSGSAGYELTIRTFLVSVHDPICSDSGDRKSSSTSPIPLTT
jgi:hypothetical protein